MDVNEDFVDIAKGFIDNGVEFLIVGAYALAAHGFPRTTGDIDIFVRPAPENAARVFRAGPWPAWETYGFTVPVQSRPS